jgi:hypothetical protein
LTALANQGASPNTIVSYGAYVDLNYMCRLGPESGSTTNPNPNTSSRPKYVDWMSSTAPMPLFFGAGDTRSQLRGCNPTNAVVDNQQSSSTYGLLSSLPAATYTALNAAAVYDSGSMHYEYGGPGTNGLDYPPYNGSGTPDGVVDDPLEWQYAPPYPYPIRGIQVKIRVFEPDSKQIREVTVAQDFLPK